MSKINQEYHDEKAFIMSIGIGMITGSVVLVFLSKIFG